MVLQAGTRTHAYMACMYACIDMCGWMCVCMARNLFLQHTDVRTTYAHARHQELKQQQLAQNFLPVCRFFLRLKHDGIEDRKINKESNSTMHSKEWREILILKLIIPSLIWNVDRKKIPILSLLLYTLLVPSSILGIVYYAYVPSMQISYRVRKYCFFYCYTHELPIDITVLPLYTIPGCMTLLLHQLRKCGPSYLLAIAS